MKNCFVQLLDCLIRPGLSRLFACEVLTGADHYLGGIARPSQSPMPEQRMAVEHLTLAFLDAFLTHDAAAMAWLGQIDDRIDDFHYYTTGTKFGIGRASYDAAQEIRSGDITREEGVALVKRFDHEFPERFADEIFKYLSINEKEFPVASTMFEQPIMDREYFRVLTDQFRSPHLWCFDKGQWALRNTVWQK